MPSSGIMPAVLDIPPLETERLVLRPWKPDKDAPAVFAYASLPEVTHYMLFDTHSSVSDAREFLERARPSAEHAYAVTVKGSDAAIGGCGITLISPHSKAEIGYVLHPNHWGKGYATEVVLRLVRYGFETLGLNRIYARADERNPASMRVMLKAGMVVEGTLRDDMYVRGEPISLTYCSILRKEWLQRGGAVDMETMAPEII